MKLRPPRPPAWALAVVVAGYAQPGRAAIYVDGGGDDVVAGAIQAEFRVVYAGQRFTYKSVGSLAGQEGFLTNDCTFDILPNCAWSPLGTGTPVDLAISVVPLTRAQVAAYNNGAGRIDGPLIQFPLYATPLTIVTHEPGLTQNGQVVLDDNALCGIFSGHLTDWSQLSNTVPPGGFSVVYDQKPGSGSTFLLTQHLHAVCNATNSTFTTLPIQITSNFGSLPVRGGIIHNPRFVATSGSPAMQAALLGARSAIGYIGPSYTSIAPASPITSALRVANLVNRINHRMYLPTVVDTTTALRNPGPGSINRMAPGTKLQAADPANWVPQIPEPTQGYPIVGYANWIISSCYSTLGSAGPVLVQYLTQPYRPSQHNLIIDQNGFASMSHFDFKFYGAVRGILLNNTSGYNLNIENSLACVSYKGR